MNDFEIPERVDYAERELSRDDLKGEPYQLFQEWLQVAVDEGIPEANACCLCTADPDGAPDGRFLLLKDVDAEGFSFFTNYGSTKAAQLDAHGRASMVFWWAALHRQVRVSGTVERLPAEDSDAYFATRPRESQLAAWASRQSHPVENREALETRLERVRQRFEGEPVPRPDFWGGYRLRPRRVEFWQGRSSRFHDRMVYQRTESGWHVERLMP